MEKLQNLRQRTGNLIGLLTLVCGFVMMWGSALGTSDSNETDRELRTKAVEINPELPRGSDNGSLVFAAGPISSKQLLEDEFLKPGPYLILRRRVEMFQWDESVDKASGVADYRLSWKEGQVDFFSFKNSFGHENPLLRFEAFTKQVDNSSFGAFDASTIIRSIRVLEPLELRADLLKDASIILDENKLYIPRNPHSKGGAQLGDMRVSYEVLPQGDYSILTVQNDERNLVGAQPSDGLVVRQGRYSLDTFMAAESGDRERVSTGLLYFGGVIFFFGLTSVLAPFASKFSLRPKFSIDGMPALVILSAVASLVIVCIFFVLAQF